MSNTNRHTRRCCICGIKATQSGRGFDVCDGDGCIKKFRVCECGRLVVAPDDGDDDESAVIDDDDDKSAEIDNDDDKSAEMCKRCRTKWGVCEFEDHCDMGFIIPSRQQKLREITVDGKKLLVGHNCGICSKCGEHECGMDDESDDSDDDEQRTLVCVTCRCNEQRERDDAY